MPTTQPSDLEGVVASIFRFNREIVKIGDRELKALPTPEMTWLAKCLTEEAGELEDAHFELGDKPEDELVSMVDACADSVIFAIGGLARMGLTEAQAILVLQAVMAANFEKKAGQKAGRAIAGVSDAVKPEGWVGPEARIKEILYGQR